MRYASGGRGGRFWRWTSIGPGPLVGPCCPGPLLVLAPSPVFGRRVGAIQGFPVSASSCTTTTGTRPLARAWPTSLFGEECIQARGDSSISSTSECRCIGTQSSHSVCHHPPPRARPGASLTGALIHLDCISEQPRHIPATSEFGQGCNIRFSKIPVTASQDLHNRRQAASDQSDLPSDLGTTGEIPEAFLSSTNLNRGRARQSRRSYDMAGFS